MSLRPVVRFLQTYRLPIRKSFIITFHTNEPEHLIFHAKYTAHHFHSAHPILVHLHQFNGVHLLSPYHFAILPYKASRFLWT